MDRRWGGGSAAGSMASADELDAANAPARTLSFEEAMSQGSRGRRGSRSSRASHASHGSHGSRGSGRVSESKGQAHADNCSVSTGSHRSDCGAPYGRQCICQMCTCGLHHCPPVPKMTHFEGETVYHHDYPKWPLENAVPRRVDRPSESGGVWQSGDEYKFDGHTEAQDAFPAYPAGAGRNPDAAATAAAARRGNDMGGGWEEAPRFEGRSVAQDAYKAPPPEALRPQAAAAPRQGNFPVQSAPFEGSSEARDAYKRYNIDPRNTQPLRPPAQELPTKALPFEGRSTAQDAYTAPPPGSARRAMRPPTAEMQREGPPTRFEGRSVAQDAYKAPPPDALRQQPGMGPRRSPQTGTPLPFEGSSEAQDAYKRYNIDPRNTRPVRQPAPELPTKALPFEGRSTSQDAYTAPPPVEAQPLRMPGRGAGAARGRGYAPPPESSPLHPSAKFEGGTEAAEAYKAYPAAQQDRRQPYRPATADRDPVKFEGASTSRMDYTAPPPGAHARPKSAAPPRGTGASAGPFEGNTEAHDAYPAYDVAAARRPPLHTAPRYTAAPDERDWRTSNRTDFTPKKADVCPVLALPKPPQFYEDPKPWKGDHVFYNKRTHRYD